MERMPKRIVFFIHHLFAATKGYLGGVKRGGFQSSEAGGAEGKACGRRGRGGAGLFCKELALCIPKRDLAVEPIGLGDLSHDLHHRLCLRDLGGGDCDAILDEVALGCGRFQPYRSEEPARVIPARSGLLTTIKANFQLVVTSHQMVCEVMAKGEKSVGMDLELMTIQEDRRIAKGTLEVNQHALFGKACWELKVVSIPAHPSDPVAAFATLSPVLLRSGFPKPVCEHLAGGPVGGAWTRELLEWKLRELQSTACNAIRTAHNPQTPAFYELCDELGILVMDEIFDGWSQKAAKDYGALHFEKWWQRDLTTWVRRNRNHPCIVIYSVGNETHGKIAPRLVEMARQHDSTRPVTSGDSEKQVMDVRGINGASEKKSFFQTGPFEKAFVATEAPRTGQVRGFYQSRTWYRDGYPNARQQPFAIPDLTEQEVFPNALLPASEMANRKQIFLSSFDNATVRANARQHWQQVRDLPWIAGNCRWTGFDYPGEATYVHGGWPFHAFAGGTHDLAGFAKDLAYFYRSQWIEEPMVHLLPHWTHPLITEGTALPVQAYSNAEEVELFLNGQSLGIDQPGRNWDEMQCQWMVPWQPGTLLAIARMGGKEVAQHQFVTASKPTALHVERDLRYPKHPIITIEAMDQNKTPYPYGENTIYAHLSGDARLLSFENGHPADPTPPVASERRAFMGKARLFLQSPNNDYQLTLGSILGERRQLTSHQVSIAVQTLQGKTASLDEALTICYTLDGTEPTLAAPRYTAPFSVPAKCTVRATAYRGSAPLLVMSETFGPRLGLHWNEKGSTSEEGSATALQSETAKSKGAIIAKMGEGYRGKGYLDFRGKEGSIDFYQENDGPPGEASLVIRYAHADPTGQRPLEVTVNNERVAIAKFPRSRSWHSDWEEITIPVKIQSGANQIRLKTRGQSGPNIDEIDLR